jgi:hypothetical protein
MYLPETVEGKRWCIRAFVSIMAYLVWSIFLPWPHFKHGPRKGTGAEQNENPEHTYL